MKTGDIPFDRICSKPRKLTPEEKENREKFKQFLDYVRIRATDHYVFPPEILTVDEITIATVGNFSASVGKPKSRKTFNVSAIVAALLSGKEVLHYKAKLPEGKKKVLYVDTEQSRVHCFKVLHRILKMAGFPSDSESSSFDFLMLREFTPQQRRNIIDMALEVDPDIGFVVIDGIRDLISDINSPGESVDIINDLMRWTNKYNIHIHTVLHLNKSDDNTRGHIGTELNNKAETVIKVVKNEVNPEVSEVRPMITREKEFNDFAFHINEEGIPENISGYNGETETKVTMETLSISQHKEALDTIFSSGPIGSYTKLTEKLMEQYATLGYKRGRTSFVMFLKLLTAKEIVKKNGREYYYYPERINLLKEKS